tara:strand:- start:7208 stop:7408 length:201 start_codon:yes stop_codon:yes gene_type:complete
MLDFSDSQKGNSRLCCQVEITEEMDGMTIRFVGGAGSPGALCLPVSCRQKEAGCPAMQAAGLGARA